MAVPPVANYTTAAQRKADQRARARAAGLEGVDIETIEPLQALIRCPYCGNAASLVDSSTIYGRSFGRIWDCRPCDAYVGVHRGTCKPLGTLANRELRKARIEAHEAFDLLWKSRGMTRSRAYEWLQCVMSVNAEDAHIAKLTVEQCRLLLEVLIAAGLEGN